MKKSKGNVESDHVRSQLETIIESPEFTGAQRHGKFLAYIAYTKLIGTLYGWEQAIDALRKDARELAHEAISFDPDDALGHAIAGFVYLYADGAVDRGIAAGITGHVRRLPPPN